MSQATPNNITQYAPAASGRIDVTSLVIGFVGIGSWATIIGTGGVVVRRLTGANP
jgi:hypothetical protein